jgi:UDP-glucose-4-epimerase GalE
MNVLVTGGAGYIGSHAVKRLREAGHFVAVIDNLYRGHRAAVPPEVPFEQVDLRKTELVIQMLGKHAIDCVMHFAALAYVGESVEQPLEYYDNNTAGSISLLQAIDHVGVKRMVFSSTCATYGEPASMPIVESMPQTPINPYGWSKLFTERCLIDYAAANPDFTFTALRYFNVAGCADDGSIGEDHVPESHVIPLLLLTALKRREHFTVFGADYPTPDGTCIRDYIHVQDLADAHIAAMDAMAKGKIKGGHFFNLGIGKGYSVRQLIDTAQRVTGLPIAVKTGPRRPGDPPELYANADKINRELGWSARITDLDEIVATAWRWFRDRPVGYGDRK